MNQKIEKNNQKQVIKKHKNENLIASNCLKLYIPTLNEKIMKNKDIHHYQRNDKRCFALKNILLWETASLVKIANLCLEAENKNEVVHSKDVVVRTIDATTLLGKVNNKMTFERNERLKNALSRIIKPLGSKTVLSLNNCQGMVWLIM